MDEHHLRSHSQPTVQMYSSEMQFAPVGLPVSYELAQQPSGQPLNYYATNVETGEIQIPESYRSHYYPPDLQMNQPTYYSQPQEANMGLYYEAADAFTGNYARSFGYNEMYENSFGEGQQPYRNMSECVQNLQMNQYCPPQASLLLEQQQERERREYFEETRDANEEEFAKQSCLKEPQTQRTGGKPFKCDKCGKTFRHEYTLKHHAHIHTRKDELYYYQCGKCKKTFGYMHTLKRHELLHNGKRTFQCDKCKETFARKTHFKQHEKIHTGEKASFQCNQCKRIFFRKKWLEKHMRTHNPVENYSLCQYAMCTKIFPSRSALGGHERTIPDQCDLENSTNILSRMAGLQQHELHLHGDQNMFQCDICNAEFFHQKQLDEHLCYDLAELFRRNSWVI